MPEKSYHSIKELVFEVIRETQGKCNYETVTKGVMKHFPESKWNPTHWSYYRYHITSEKGRLNDAFGNTVKKNLTSGIRKGVGRLRERGKVEKKGKKKKRETKEEKIKRIGDSLLDHVRFVIDTAAGRDEQMQFKLNRWVYGRLMQDEIRQKRPVKQALWDSGMRSCQRCGKKFGNLKGVEIHRKDSDKIYSVENCELLCRPCHQT